jgi:two-component system, NtrC family, response regulator HydG
VKRLRRPLIGYAPPALDRVLHYPWPGNIRELEHAIERACAVAAGPRIEVEDLPTPVRHAPLAGEDARDSRPLRVREQEHILTVLARHHGNRRAAAAELRISLSTLKRRLRHRHR